MAQTQHTTAPRSFKNLKLGQRELRRGTVNQRNSDLTERNQYFLDAGQRVY